MDEGVSSNQFMLFIIVEITIIRLVVEELRLPRSRVVRVNIISIELNSVSRF